MCKSKSFCVMLTVNLLLLCLGIALTVVAGLVKTNRQTLVEHAHISEADVNEVMPASDVNVALAGGCLLMFVALVGVVGACKSEGAFGKILLCLYSLFMVVVIVLEIAAFALIVVITNRLDDFSNDVSANKLDQVNTKIMGFVNDTRCACCDPAWTMGTCGAKAGEESTSDACKLLKDIVSEANCASNQAFTKPVVNWINSKLRAVSIFSIVVAVIQLCTLCASCCLMCRKKKERNDFQPAGPGSYQNPQPIGSGAAAQGQQVVYA